MRSVLSSLRPIVSVASLVATAALVTACSSGSESADDGEVTNPGGAGKAGSGGAAGKAGSAGKGGAAGKAASGAGGVSGAGGNVPVAGSAGKGSVGGSGGTGGSVGGNGGSDAGQAGSTTGGTAGKGGTAGNAGTAGKGGTAGAGGNGEGGKATGGSTAGGASGGSDAGGTSGGTSSGGSSAGTAGSGGTASGGAASGGASGGTAGAGGATSIECTVDADCGVGTSNRCIEGLQGKKICAEVCKDSCSDPLFRCALIVPTGKPAYEICIPKYAQSCRPCDTDSQCRFPDDETDKGRCVPSGNTGSFCATDCSATSCGEGYACEDKLLGNGQTVKACVPKNGDLCTCQPFWAGRGYKTTCGTQNGFGSCKGIRTCDAGTLSACDAKVASLEVCDGIDSDCDGSVDDFVDCDDGSPCTIDTCVPSAAGGASCKSAIKPNNCKIGFACYTAGQANPANPCQVCDPSRAPDDWSDDDGKACSDDTTCTTGDMCKGGVCKGTPKVDDYEPNDSRGAAKAGPSWDDCTNSFSKSITATLFAEGDEDWYSLAYKDSSNPTCQVNPKFRLEPPPGVAMGYDVYYKCSNGDGTPVSGCNGATTVTLAAGITGCRRSPSASQQEIDIDFDCAGVGGDDGGIAYVRVWHASGAPQTCSTYTVKYGE